MTHNSINLISRLRYLRADERRLRSSVVEDLRHFQKPDGGSFLTWPDSPGVGISVTTTCTALMALIYSDRLFALFSKGQPSAEVSTAPAPADKPRAQGKLPPIGPLFAAVVRADWRSSDLPELNAFSSCIVVRAAGFLVRAGIISSADVAELKHREQTLKDVVIAKVSNVPGCFAVEGYPAKTTMAYWFVDGITLAGVDIGYDSWEAIAVWAAREFYREAICVASGNEQLMDPPSLAMAASLIARIRRFCGTRDDLFSITSELPSRVELTYAIDQVFAEQTESGIWQKYFPLFHFPTGRGAADYCFSFEFLEAILIEFAELDILTQDRILEGIERAVRWCDGHRFTFRKGGRDYQGWNSGGEGATLAAGKPEAWATASIHMFLAELDSAVSAQLDKLILTRFDIDRSGVTRSDDRWNKLIDINLEFPGEEPTTLKDVVEQELISKSLQLTPQGLRKQAMKPPRSALLFGPPGTSKTSIAEGIAQRLGWPLIVITPSDFLSRGLEQIYGRVDEIFDDLMDISAAVVLFDEMDALAQTRGNEELDVTRQLLTTSMLPKLADLWAHGRVIFLMATNHRQQLDPAITRPGRFDLLLCVGPPTWAAKLEGLPQVLKDVRPEDVGDLSSVRQKLQSLCDSSCAQKQLDMFTVAELRSFLVHLKRRKRANDLLGALSTTHKKEFEDIVTEWARATIALSSGSDLEKEYNEDRTACRRQ